MADRKPVMTGGCQCGAVRYALYAAPERHSICWCRMCQKANGAYLAAHTGVKRADFAWTRDAPGTFASSEAVERDFCRQCGTPLTYRNLGADRVSISIPTLDEPYAVTPTEQYGTENRPMFAAWLAQLPEVPTAAWMKPEDAARFASRQHPDRETGDGTFADDWSPAIKLPIGRASRVVRQFLALMEARDLEASRAYLAPGFTMTFPGNNRFTTLEQLVAFARERYRFVKKSYEAFDESAGLAETVVTCHGTLTGEWLDGRSFKDIRFVDRFAVATSGKILTQQVWNDLAEHRTATTPD